MREQIEAERSRLREEKDMAEEERDRAEAALRRHEAELGRAQSDHDAMKQKLAALEKKIIVGGENLLDKVYSVCAHFAHFKTQLTLEKQMVARVSRKYGTALYLARRRSHS